MTMRKHTPAPGIAHSAALGGLRHLGGGGGGGTLTVTFVVTPAPDQPFVKGKLPGRDVPFPDGVWIERSAAAAPEEARAKP
jgi:hypothetical protein